MMNDFSALEEKIEYTFQNKSLLAEALTHSSYANEVRNGTKCNERMEFLGDAVLSIVTAELLYNKFPDMPEGSRAFCFCKGNMPWRFSASGQGRKEHRRKRASVHS